MIAFMVLSAGALSAADSYPDEEEAPPTRARRIIGGQESRPDAWPWMAALIYPSTGNDAMDAMCGGSLIRPDWVLTAAHCLYNSNTGQYEPDQVIDVVLNRNDLTGTGGEKIRVKRKVVHPDYDWFENDADIALLELETASTQTPVPIIAQAVDAPLVASGDAVGIGWGAMDPNGYNYPDKLRQVALPLMTNAACQAAREMAGIDLTENMLCAGYEAGGKDTCSGDSGGPLFIANLDETPLQIGITSFGPGCALPNAYGVYTRVSRFTGWIADQTCGKSEIPGGVHLEIDVNGRTATISFDAVQGATGYQLYSAPYPEASPVMAVDIGQKTQWANTYDDGADFFALVRSYNGNCVGGVSNVVHVVVD